MKYMTALPFMFAVPKYRKTLERICGERDIELNYRHNLVEINHSQKEATFEVLDENMKRVRLETFDVSLDTAERALAALGGLQSSP